MGPARASSSESCLIGGEVDCPMEGDPVTIPLYLVTTRNGVLVGVTIEGGNTVEVPYKTSNTTSNGRGDGWPRLHREEWDFDLYEHIKSVAAAMHAEFRCVCAAHAGDDRG